MKKVTILLIFIVTAIIFYGCSKQQTTKKNGELKTGNSAAQEKITMSEKQKEFSDLIRSKLYAKEYIPISLDTAGWNKYSSEKYKFSFKHPEFVEVIEQEENFEEGVSFVLCLNKKGSTRSTGCDMDFILYNSAGEKKYFEGISEYFQVFELDPKMKENSNFQVIKRGNSELMYTEGLHQELVFYNSDDKLFMMFADPHFLREVDDEDIVKGIIQSIEL